MTKVLIGGGTGHLKMLHLKEISVEFPGKVRMCISADRRMLIAGKINIMLEHIVA